MKRTEYRPKAACSPNEGGEVVQRISQAAALSSAAEGVRVQLLVLAGHDSSGRAGITVDRETAQVFGVDVECVVTAWTQQDARGMSRLGARDPREWQAQMRLQLKQGVQAIKVGLLPGEEAVQALAQLELSTTAAGVPVILDPVIAASSGERFLDKGAVKSLRLALRSMGAILTPNLCELSELSGLDQQSLVEQPEARVDAAAILLESGARAVLVKAGHGLEEPMRELLLRPCAEPVWIEQARVPGSGIRGSGCRHATALAAGLAMGMDLEQAARKASAWVRTLIEQAGENQNRLDG